MMPEEWPIAAEAADSPVDSARPRGGRRLASVRRDFFIDPADRLTEQERALMTAMLIDLIETLSTGIVAAMASPLDTMAEATDIAARLTKAGLLDRSSFVALLLRRADEHRIAAAFTGRSGPRRLPLIPTLVGDANGDVAAAAMALVVARGRRRDAFGQPRLELSDLAADDATSLVHAIAAAMSAGVDEPALAQGAETVLSRHEPRDSLDAAAASLVEALEGAGRTDDVMVETVAEEGEAALLSMILARRAAIDSALAWDYLVSAGSGRLALLSRMAGLSRQTAARLLAELGAHTGAAAIEEEIARFDEFSDEAVKAAVTLSRLPAAFRQARYALGPAHG